MTQDEIRVQNLMKKCQRGIAGRGAALEEANNLLAECYGMLGKLLADTHSLTKERDQLREDRDGLLEAGAHLL
ncbi:hypothetical protein ACF8GG_16330 [Pseudomonas sp. yb_1]|uniref:hypothetical protein n=1 Tax=Pseudomonas sp. yb_1 TaxID=3367217 RepID=UPI00370B24D6